MALGTNNTGVAEAGNFIPEMWSDDVVAAYKSELIAANCVTHLDHAKKKGDTIHIPAPVRGSANAKVTDTEVVLNGGSNTVIDVSLNKHFEYSQLIEDIAGIQALDSMRAFYTNDAGYALAKQVDSDIMAQLETLQGGGSVGTGTWTGAVIGGDGETAYLTATTGNSSAITDAAIRKMSQTLDDADVPQSDRCMWIPPVAKSTLLGLARFTEQAFYGDADALKTGLIGDIYGIKVYVTTNCPTEVSGDLSTLHRVGAIVHKSAIVHAEQMAVRSQTQYKQEHLADLFTADTIYGVQELRNDGGIAFVVPA